MRGDQVSCGDVVIPLQLRLTDSRRNERTDGLSEIQSRLTRLFDDTLCRSLLHCDSLQTTLRIQSPVASIFLRRSDIMEPSTGGFALCI